MGRLELVRKTLILPALSDIRQADLLLGHDIFSTQHQDMDI